MSPYRFSQANGSCGPYKPVPPPKPFAGSPLLPPHHHHQQQQQQQLRQQQLDGNGPSHAHHNGHITYPHILVTDQGHFVTHSTKFPIEENEKLVKMLKEANSSLRQGIDNPGLVSDPPMIIESQSQPKELTPNHYAPMRAYDPSKHPTFMPNGASQGFSRPSFIHGYPAHSEASWQSHAPPNSSVRFTTSAINQNPKKNSYVNGQLPSSQPSGVERSFFHPSHLNQNNAAPRLNYSYDPARNLPQYPETNERTNEVYTQSEVPGITHHSQSNGVALNGPHNGSRYDVENGDVNKQNSTNHDAGAPLQISGNEEGSSKKDEKWGSLKRASKKCSHLRNILTGKFSKNDTQGSTDGANTSGLTQSKGTSSQDRTKEESRGEVPNSERLHNGENHTQENKNFQRAVTYSSLKTRLEGPPQQSLDPTVHSGCEKQSIKNIRNLNEGFPFPCPYGNQIQNGVKQPGILGPKRSGSCSHIGAKASEESELPPSSWGILYRSDDNLTRPLASDQSYPEQSSIKPKEGASVHFHTREGRASGGGSDSGRGTGGGSATEFKGHDTSLESGSSNRVPLHGHSSGNESEWIDIPESEGNPSSFKGILHNGVKYPEGTRTPPLPPLSPEVSPTAGKRGGSKSKKQSGSFSSRGTKKPDIVQTTEQNSAKVPSSSHAQTGESGNQSSRSTNPPPTPKSGWTHRNAITNSSAISGKDPTANPIKSRFVDQIQSRGGWRSFGPDKEFDEDELTSTDAALDLNSMLDGVTEASTDDELASNRDDDAYLIRRQLEGLEGMYSEVLKVLGGRRNLRQGDPRLLRRRTHGSVSSLPSSVMSNRASKDRKGKVIDDRLRRTSRDIPKNTHKRFQRLESHVVTLARSVAHLSSEMRTQHLMLQEIESIRNDIANLKMSIKANQGSHSRGGPFRSSRLWNGIGSGMPPFSNPGKVKKLTQFFGDEPPLVRIFLKKLGYEKYAPIFEKEKIGMLELPYMTEERLHKIGIPLGPRLRILEEARGPITTDGNLSVYVV